MQSVLEFFDHWFAINWETDSKVAICVSERLGVGKIKHLEVKSLWLQERVKLNQVLPVKVPTLVNEADLNTKVHAQKRFEFLLPLMGIADYVKEVASSAWTAREATAGGLTGVAPRTLALAVVLDELLGQGSSQREVALSETCTQVGSTAYAFTSMAQLAFAVLFTVLVLGCYVGWKFARWVNPRSGPVLVGSPATRHKKGKKVDKATQSQTRYSWHSASPRFLPLNEFDQGCWSENG